MKNLSYLIGILLLWSCQNENKSDSSSAEDSPNMTFEMVQEPNSQDNVIDLSNPTANTAPPEVNIPAGADGITHHYICADRCKGGHGENPGSCPICGKTMAHNKAWHDVQNQNAQTGQANNFGPRVDAPQPQVNTNQPQEVNYPAGADGIVHHYVCVDKCAGGFAPSPGNCGVCRKPLAHNKAWHNQ